jgi:hypothetical protein
MDLLDDYRDEMDALSSEQVEAVISGRVPREPAAARAATLVEDLRDALREEPSSEVARAHLAAMAAAAEESGLTRSRRLTMPAVTRRRIGGLTLAATLVMGGGLAAAVTQPELPDQASEEAWANVGQGPEVAAEASAHGKAVAAVAQDPTLEGCQKGQAVAEVASSKADDHRQDEADRDPCVQAERVDGVENGGGNGNGSGSGNGRGNGEGASAFGNSTSEQAQADGQAFGEKTSTAAQENGEAFGQETAAAASGGNAGGNGNGNGGGGDGEFIELPTDGGPLPGTPGGPPGS